MELGEEPEESKRRGPKSKDRISNLVPDIKKHILSLVTTRDAILTSTLSKTWRYDWLGIPCLYFGQDFFFKRWKFEDEYVYKRACDIVPDLEEVFRYLDFVDQVVQRRKLSIQKLYLYIPPIPELSPRVASSLDRLDVKELNIEIIGDSDISSLSITYYAPQCVFMNNSITKLTIRGCNLSGATVSEINLPSLRELSLSDVVTDDQVIKKLIASSTATEKLCFLYCKGFESLEVSGLPLLVHLEHEYNRGLRSVEIDAANLRSLVHLPHSDTPCELVLIAACPYLTHLKLKGNSYFYVEALRKISRWSTSLQTLSISNGDIHEGLPIHKYLVLSELKLIKCLIINDWLHQHLCKIASLRDLEVAYCSGSEPMKISSDYVRRLAIRDGRKLEYVTMNCPNLHEFNYCTKGRIITLSPIAESVPTAVNLQFHLNATGDSAWDVNLVALLKELKQSKFLSVETYLIENVIIPRKLRQKYDSPVCQFEQLKIFTEAAVSSLDVKRCIDAVLWLCPRLKTLQILHKMVSHPGRQAANAGDEKLSFNFLLKLNYKATNESRQQSCGCYSTQLAVNCWRHTLKDFQIIEQHGFEDSDGSVRKFLESSITH